ncbi:strictosidine synthase [Labrys wisconsinensis]|uniref:Strictosidine synthase conserved region domain-containing protein n=1 Tax=Labrys wisconsinensis TaxID=425677 RepID=A0ABU0JID3_9HYPH|nr:strictosidine synthase [Labrys wisconsinensis]MDQ0474039.1 hypothetical protein [Labrys wisconsinensis]
MIALISRLRDRLTGAGEHAVTMPPMDGALRPNRALEEAPLVLQAQAPDALVATPLGVLFTSGNHVRRLPRHPDEAAETVRTFDAPVSCLAAGRDGSLAVGLTDRRIIFFGGSRDGQTLDKVGGRPLVCPTALAFDEEGALIVCLGSSRHAPQDWRRDLMQRGATGSVWRIEAGGKATCLADALAYPHGVLARGGRIFVSESWRSRILAIRPDGPPAPVLSDLPGYPARLAPRTGGGAWLAVFAPRSQLIEFVLRERSFREQMMAEVEEAHWIAPSLTAPRSFLEPMQGGALKQLGILKPWAPTRSFGLVVGLDHGFRPDASWHSRADGVRHGITAAIEAGGRLLVASKGGDAILTLPLPSVEAAR